jgi:hypothetical protein
MTEKEECYACGFKTYLKQFSVKELGNEIGKTNLCYLCSNTMNGNSQLYQSTISCNNLGSIICFIGNKILEKLDDVSKK